MAGTARFELAMTESKSGVLPVTLRPNILLLMEVNLVFSNHPETRKEVCIFMIIHQGDVCYPFSMQEIVYDRF